MAMAEIGGGEVAADDRLSDLHDDHLLLILVRLDVPQAARTSVLSRRWRRVWALLPVLCFPDGRHTRAVLAASEAPTLHGIYVTASHDAAGSVAAWLPLAAHRLYGGLFYNNTGPERHDDEEEEEEEAVPLPCFGNAAVINLDLWFLRLALPPAGAFDRLHVLVLRRVRFRGPVNLGDVVSSPRCPRLQVLIVGESSGLDTLAVSSNSLLKMELWLLNGLRELTVVAPALEELISLYCFDGNQLIEANIAAPHLVRLHWHETYDESSVQLGDLGRLQQLGTPQIQVYGNELDRMDNRNIQLLWQQFQAIHSLYIMLNYDNPDTDDSQYLMQDITYLPDVTWLTMTVVRGEHSFGASFFHVLRLCPRITKLSLNLQLLKEQQYPCQPGCFCEQPTNWKTEELLLNCLKEVDVSFLEGCENEMVFLKLLFNWAPVLEDMSITFDDSVGYCKCMDLHQTISSFSRPGICMKFYIHDHAGNKLLFS